MGRMRRGEDFKVPLGWCNNTQGNGVILVKQLLREKKRKNKMSNDNVMKRREYKGSMEGRS